MSKRQRKKQTNLGYIISVDQGSINKQNFYHVPFNIGDSYAKTFYRNYKVKGYKRIPESIGELKALELLLGSRIEALKALAEKYDGVKHPMNMR